MSDQSDMPDNLRAALIGMDIENAALALIASIGADGRATPRTNELLLEVTLRLVEDDPVRQGDAVSFLVALAGCLSQMAAQASRELEKRGVVVNWNLGS